MFQVLAPPGVQSIIYVFHRRRIPMPFLSKRRKAPQDARGVSSKGPNRFGWKVGGILLAFDAR